MSARVAEASNTATSIAATSIAATGIAAASIALLLLCGCAPRETAVTGPSIAAAPDWSGGLWVRDEDPNTGDVGTMRGDTLPLTPEWRKKSDALNRIRAAGGALPANESRCIPTGMPYMMMANSVEFIYSPGRIGILGGSRGIQIRNIFTDGRKHTADEFLLDSFSGESIGAWQGDTLSVDTIAVRASNEMIYALKGTKMHIVERMRLSAPNRLEITTTVTDPAALAAPWVYVNTYTKHPERFTTDGSYCVSAYDRTVDPRSGEQGFDLTPPPEEGIGLPQSLAQH